MPSKKPALSRSSQKSVIPVRPLMEGLEGRQLFAATLTLTNPFILPASDRLMFSVIGDPTGQTPNNVTHTQQTLTISDTGTTPLTLSSMTLSGPFAFVNAPSGGYNGVTVQPGTPLTVTIKFTQTTVPAHSVNETNYTTAVNDGAEIGGSLTIVSNDSVSPTKVVALAGYYQQVSNNNEEPNLTTIVNKLAGYDTNIGVTPSSTSLSNPQTSDVDLNEPNDTAKLYGSEIYSSSWEQASTSTPVTVEQLDAYRTQGNTATVYWYTSSSEASHELFRATAAQGQTLLPTTSDTGTTPLKASFSPGVAFGLRVDDEYSDDTINLANNNNGGGGHHFRFFPLVDENGNTVANTYIVAMDYGAIQAENFDFNDNVFIVTNIRPATTPGTPANLTVTNGATPTLSWTADNYSPVAYNVYRSTSANGTYTLLTPSRITSTTYTDTSAPSSGAIYYEVTAVDTSSVATSVPATAIANGGPVAASYTFAATPGATQQFDPLANDTDPTGTIQPSTVLISTGPNKGGTASVNTSTGEITYTPSSSFTGVETLSYTVADSNGVRSAPGTVTFNVGSAIGSASGVPTTNPFVGQTLENTAVTLSVLSADTAATSFGNNAVALITSPSDGSAAVSSNGTITYTPSANFVGGDSFTYKVTDADGQVSAATTVDVNVGVAVGSTGAYRNLVFKDTDGTEVTVTLNKGTADVYFDGIGTAVAPTKGKTLTVAGTGMYIRTIGLSGTTTASTLNIVGQKNGSVTFGGVTDSSPLGTLNAKTSNLLTNGGTSDPVAGNASPAGYIGLAGVRSILLKEATDGTIVLGNAGVTSTAATFTGAVGSTVFSSAVPVNKLSAPSWTATSGETPGPINAPAISSLVVSGEFDADLTLSSSLGAARIGGPVDDGFWTITGNAKSIILGSTGTGFGGVDVGGTLTAMTVSKGNLVSDVTAGSIGTLHVSGIMSGDVQTTGNLKTLTVGALLDSAVSVGTFTDLAGVTSDDIGTATLGALHLTGTGVVFNDSTVIAHTISAVTSGQVNGSSTSPEGLAAVSIRSAAVRVNNSTIHLNAAALASDSALASYLQAKGLTLGTFEIDIV